MFAAIGIQASLPVTEQERDGPPSSYIIIHLVKLHMSSCRTLELSYSLATLSDDISNCTPWHKNLKLHRNHNLRILTTKQSWTGELRCVSWLALMIDFPCARRRYMYLNLQNGEIHSMNYAWLRQILFGQICGVWELPARPCFSLLVITKASF